MNSISKTLRTWAGAALAASALLTQAYAAPVVYVDPATQDINSGVSATVNIWVEGLAEAVGGVQFVLDFDATYLEGTALALDPDNKMGDPSLDPILDLSGGWDNVAGSLDVFFAAGAGFDEVSLSALQGTKFRIATLTFLGQSPGLSPLTFSGLALSKWDGVTTIAGVTSRDGKICVDDCKIIDVPEPGSLLLAASALAMLASRRRLQKA